jgi:hypothetical protein
VDIHSSARKYGVTDEDIHHAIDDALAIEDAGEDPDRWSVRRARLLRAAARSLGIFAPMKLRLAQRGSLHSRDSGAEPAGVPCGCASDHSVTPSAGGSSFQLQASRCAAGDDRARRLGGVPSA